MGSIRDKVATVTLPAQRVHVDEWDVTFEVRSITVDELRRLSDEDDAAAAGLRMLIAALYDPDTGEPAFTNDDVALLGGQSAGVVNDLLESVLEVSGIAPDALKVGKGGS